MMVLNGVFHTPYWLLQSPVEDNNWLKRPSTMAFKNLITAMEKILITNSNLYTNLQHSYSHIGYKAGIGRDVKCLTFVNFLVQLEFCFLPINKICLIKDFPKRESDHSVVITSRYYYLLL